MINPANTWKFSISGKQERTPRRIPPVEGKVANAAQNRYAVMAPTSL